MSRSIRRGGSRGGGGPRSGLLSVVISALHPVYCIVYEEERRGEEGKERTHRDNWLLALNPNNEILLLDLNNEVSSF